MVEVTVPVPEGLDENEARDVAQTALLSLAGARMAARLVAADLAKVERAPGPGHLAQIALREEQWRAVEVRWGLLTPRQVTEMTGGNVEHVKSHTANLRTRNGLVGLPRNGRLYYPGFQLVEGRGGHPGRVAPAWAEVQRILAPARWDDDDLLAWATAPNARLDGRSPAEEIQASPDEVGPLLRAAAEAAVPRVTQAAIA